MTDLIQESLFHGGRVGAFPVREYWLDIGHLADLEKAHGDFERIFQ